MSLLSLTDSLTQSEARRYAESTLGTEPWLTVYEHVDTPMFDGTVFCALIPNDRVAHAIGLAGWDLTVGRGGPGFSEKQGEVTYDAWNLYHGVRPLVIKRTFHATVEGVQVYELLEEFRLFHNLAYAPRSEEYLDVSSTPTPVARWREGRLEIRRKAVRQFLAAKEMHLALFFQLNRRSQDDIATVPPAERDVRHDTKELVYELAVRPRQAGPRGKSFSKLIGKRMVSPLPIAQIGTWPYGGQDRYEEFIVDIDASGEPVYHTCDPDALGYSKAPYSTDTIHFRREVLARYYGDLSRYSIDRYRLHCSALWGVELIEDSAEGMVYVTLGDLGMMPYDEQQYWKAFNVEPGSGRRVAKAYGSPEPSHDFRDAYAEANAVWAGVLGWPLFRPLAPADLHNLDGLRVPLDRGQAEFDNQVQALAKVAVDSLNEKPIRKAAQEAGVVYSGGEKGIAKLDAYLDVTRFEAGRYGLDRSPTAWMKDVQWLRSASAAHRKESSFEKAVEHFKIKERGRPAVIRDLLDEGRWVLLALAQHADDALRGGVI